jgi:hypothetical protein
MVIHLNHDTWLAIATVLWQAPGERQLELQSPSTDAAAELANPSWSLMNRLKHSIDTPWGQVHT